MSCQYTSINVATIQIESEKSGTTAPVCPKTDVARYSHPQKKLVLQLFFFSEKDFRKGTCCKQS